MKSFLFLLVLFCSNIPLLYSQDYSFKFGEESPYSIYTFNRYDFIGKTKMNHLLIKRSGKCESYSPDLKNMIREEIVNKYNKKSRRIEKVKYINDKLVVFSTYKSKKTKILELQYDIYDPHNLEKKQMGNTLTSFQSLKKRESSRTEKGSYNIIFNDDMTFFATYIFLETGNEVYPKVRVSIFNNEFEKISENEKVDFY